MFGSNVSEVWFEHYNTNSGRAIRMVVFETDPETGAKCIMDIMEAYVAKLEGRNWLARQAADYNTWGDNEVTYNFRFSPSDEVAPETGADYRMLDEIDTGKCRKVDSKIARAMDMMVA